MMEFLSTKTYAHNVGLSACFRQWRADSHCKFLHGYALQVKLTFGCSHLDPRNWVQDFGGLKSVKTWLETQFDHKTLIAKDDPKLEMFQQMASQGIIQLNVVEGVGCEMFADMVFKWVSVYVAQSSGGRVWLQEVEVREHEGNSAICRR